jgi:hypothetical protein
MKAILDKDGTLHISAETELESYALSMWIKQNANLKTFKAKNLLMYTLPKQEVNDE